MWGIGEIVWGGSLCYQASTSGDVVASGTTTPYDYDAVAAQTFWAQPGTGEIEIVDLPDPPTDYYRITIAGELSSGDADVDILIRIYNASHVLVTTLAVSTFIGAIGPGSNVPFTFSGPELNTSPGFIDFAISDPDEGGATLHAGATVEICPAAEPG